MARIDGFDEVQHENMINAVNALTNASQSLQNTESSIAVDKAIMVINRQKAILISVYGINEDELENLASPG